MNSLAPLPEAKPGDFVRSPRNRTIWDRTRKRPGSSDTILDHIRDGLPVRVLDRDTGKDVTSYVLCQCLVDLVKIRAEVVSPETGTKS